MKMTCQKTKIMIKNKMIFGLARLNLIKKTLIDYIPLWFMAFFNGYRFYWFYFITYTTKLLI